MKCDRPFEGDSFRFERDDIFLTGRLTFGRWQLALALDKELDAINKAHLPYNHAKINGVEVPAAVKTS